MLLVFLELVEIEYGTNWLQQSEKETVSQLYDRESHLNCLKWETPLLGEELEESGLKE